MDLHFRSDRAGDGGEAGVFGGAMDFRRMLFLRLKIEGFGVAIGWAFWNVKSLAQIDQMAVVSCDLRDAQSNVMYVGGERLALLGNRLADARDSHVLRVWQAWRVITSYSIHYTKLYENYLANGDNLSFFGEVNRRNRDRLADIGIPPATETEITDAPILALRRVSLGLLLEGRP